MTKRMSLVEYRKKFKKKTPKYNNKKVTLNGQKFDSQMEARYYQQLLWLTQAKQIKKFTLQPRYLLLDAFEKDGMKFRKIEYVADFEVHSLDGSIEVVDVKGAETKEFLLKKKLFHAKYPHKLSIVTYDKTHGWIELEKLKKIKKSR